MPRPVIRPVAPGPLPLHAQVERSLRQLVAATPPGGLLPPETELARRLRVSRTTVRQAMQRLVTAGLVARTPGRGTEVIDRHIDTQLDFTPFARALEASGHEVRTASAEVIRRPADTEEAAALEIAPGAEIRELRRVRLVDDVPTGLLVTVLAPRVPLPDDLSGSLYEFLEGAGIHLTVLSDSVSAVAASPEIAKALAVPRRSPVLMIRRVARDDVSDPVEFTRTYLRSGTGYAVEHKR